MRLAMQLRLCDFVNNLQRSLVTLTCIYFYRKINQNVRGDRGFHVLLIQLGLYQEKFGNNRMSMRLFSAARQKWTRETTENERKNGVIGMMFHAKKISCSREGARKWMLHRSVGYRTSRGRMIEHVAVVRGGGASRGIARSRGCRGGRVRALIFKVLKYKGC